MIQYIYNFFTELVFSLIIPGIGLGIFAIIASNFVPSLLPQYKLPLQIGGLILVIFFIFQYGREWEYDKAKVKRVEDKLQIDKLTEETLRVNKQLSDDFSVRTKNVKAIKNEPTIIYVNKEADNKCIIEPNVALDITGLLNSAIEGKLPTTTSRVNEKAK